MLIIIIIFLVKVILTNIVTKLGGVVSDTFSKQGINNIMIQYI